MVISYAMGEDYKTPLIQAALQNASRDVTLDAGAIFHSGRGSNCTSYDFASTITEFGLRQSVAPESATITRWLSRSSPR